MNKLEGPGTTVSFLVILIDIARLELWLLLDKLARLRRLVTSWLGGGLAVAWSWSRYLAISPTQQLCLNQGEFSGGNCSP